MSTFAGRNHREACQLDRPTWYGSKGDGRGFPHLDKALRRGPANSSATDRGRKPSRQPAPWPRPVAPVAAAHFIKGSRVGVTTSGIRRGLTRDGGRSTPTSGPHRQPGRCSDLRDANASSTRLRPPPTGSAATAQAGALPGRHAVTAIPRTMGPTVSGRRMAPGGQPTSRSAVLVAPRRRIEDDPTAGLRLTFISDVGLGISARPRDLTCPAAGLRPRPRAVAAPAGRTPQWRALRGGGCSQVTPRSGRGSITTAADSTLIASVARSLWRI